MAKKFKLSYLPHNNKFSYKLKAFLIEPFIIILSYMFANLNYFIYNDIGLLFSLVILSILFIIIMKKPTLDNFYKLKKIRDIGLIFFEITILIKDFSFWNIFLVGFLNILNMFRYIYIFRGKEI